MCHVGVQCDLPCPPVAPTISDSSPGPVTSTPTKGNISGMLSEVDISDINDLESTTAYYNSSTTEPEDS